MCVSTYKMQTQQQKNKRRMRASPVQLAQLRKAFAEDPKPDQNTRQEIGDRINMTPRSVQIWFQNNRAKCKVLEKKTRYKLPLKTSNCSDKVSRVYVDFNGYNKDTTPLSVYSKPAFAQSAPQVATHYLGQVVSTSTTPSPSSFSSPYQMSQLQEYPSSLGHRGDTFYSASPVSDYHHDYGANSGDLDIAKDELDSLFWPERFTSPSSSLPFTDLEQDDGQLEGCQDLPSDNYLTQSLPSQSQHVHQPLDPIDPVNQNLTQLRIQDPYAQNHCLPDQWRALPMLDSDDQFEESDPFPELFPNVKLEFEPAMRELSESYVNPLNQELYERGD